MRNTIHVDFEEGNETTLIITIIDKVGENRDEFSDVIIIGDIDAKSYGTIIKERIISKITFGTLRVIPLLAQSARSKNLLLVLSRNLRPVRGQLRHVDPSSRLLYSLKNCSNLLASLNPRFQIFPV